MNKRDELLSVATQLVDVGRLHQKSGSTYNGKEIYKEACSGINDRALKAAKDLIEKVDAEFEGRAPVADSMRDAAPEMYEMLQLAVSYIDRDSVEDFAYSYQNIKALLAKARGEG